MTEIRYVQTEDKEFWYGLDKHLPEQEFNNKISNQQGYILLENKKPIGLLRYNLFGDNTPFCTMLVIDLGYQGKGYGNKKYLDIFQVYRADTRAHFYTGIPRMCVLRSEHFGPLNVRGVLRHCVPNKGLYPLRCFAAILLWQQA